MLAQQTAHSKSEMGQGLVEYALIIVFLAVVLMLGLELLGEGIISALYNNIIANL